MHNAQLVADAWAALSAFTFCSFMAMALVTSERIRKWRKHQQPEPRFAKVIVLRPVADRRSTKWN